MQELQRQVGLYSEMRVIQTIGSRTGFFIWILSPQSFCISVTVVALSIVISVAMQSFIGISKAYVQDNPANSPDPLGEYKLC